jgi:hypothetical protein
LFASVFGLCLYANLFCPGRHHGENDSNNDRRPDPQDRLALKRFPKLEREIELITQPGQIARQAITGMGRFLPQFVE